MARTKRTPYTILGLLSIQPMSGYDIKKWLEEYLSYFWNESWGQIYPALKKLEEEGLIRIESEHPSQGGKKKIYSITDPGREELRAYLDAPPVEDIMRNELLLKLFFGRASSPRVIRRHIEEELKKQELIEKCRSEVVVDASKDCNHPVDAIYWKYGLKYAQKYNRFIQEWCREVLEDMDNDFKGEES